MKQYFHYAIFPLVLILAACQTETTPQQQSSKPEIAMPDFSRLQQLKQPAPKAAIATHTVEHHGQTLKDDYHWLKDQGYPEVDDQEVIDYLKAENAYYDEFLKPNQNLAA